MIKIDVSQNQKTQAQIDSGQNEQAIDDTLAVNLKKAQKMVQDGKKEEASKILSGIMFKYPNNKEAVQWWLIANMKRSPTGEVDAIPMLDSLHKSYPANTGILFFKIFIQTEHGMNQEALSNVEKLILLQPDDAENWILKGQILQGLDKHKEACSAFEMALKLNPSRTDVWGMKASSLSKSEQYEEAIMLMNKAIELSPDAADLYYNRGCIYCLKGDKTNALADLRKAFNLNQEFKNYALTDSDLKNLYDDEEFKKITK
jgi:tetratricopeptide (TPR) repeat protein